MSGSDWRLASQISGFFQNPTHIFYPKVRFLKRKNSIAKFANQMHEAVHDKLDADGDDQKTHNPGNRVQTADAQNAKKERRNPQTAPNHKSHRENRRDDLPTFLPRIVLVELRDEVRNGAGAAQKWHGHRRKSNVGFVFIRNLAGAFVHAALFGEVLRHQTKTGNQQSHAPGNPQSMDGDAEKTQNPGPREKKRGQNQEKIEAGLQRDFVAFFFAAFAGQGDVNWDRARRVDDGKKGKKGADEKFHKLRIEKI